jgi:Na+/H+-translocating membrane pyrophosphatase
MQTQPLGTHSPLVALPFWIAAAGIVASIIGVFLVRTKEMPDKTNMEKQRSLLWSIRTGVFIAAIISAGLVAAEVHILGIGYRVWGCMAIGLLAGIAIGLFTEYATSFTYSPTQGISRSGNYGPATVIIEGLSVGMWSAVPPLIIIVVTIICCLYLAGPYGMSIAAVGMLATLAITLATDAYGPVADNAVRLPCCCISSWLTFSCSVVHRAALRRCRTRTRMCASAPTRLTRSATRPQRRARASPSARRC